VTAADGEVAVLCSGGLDSAVLVGHLARQGRVVHPVYVRFGLAWEDVEAAYLRRFLATVPELRPLVDLSLPASDLYGSHWSVSGTDVPDATTPDEAVYLPGRNVLLLAKSSVWCALNGVRTIALGTLAANPFPDSSRDFFDRLGAVLGLALSSPLEVLTPFATLTKADVLALGSDLALEQTFSCIAPRDGLHCGACNKCAERRLGFHALGRPDITEYADAPAPRR
jgi:7-cyano-7-deazaguanine synthase